MIRNILLIVMMTIPSFCIATKPAISARMQQAVSNADLPALKRLVKLLDLDKNNADRLPLYTNLLVQAREIAIEGEDIAVLNNPSDATKTIIGIPIMLLGIFAAYVANARNNAARGVAEEKKLYLWDWTDNISDSSSSLITFLAAPCIFFIGSLMTYKGITCSAQTNYLNKIQEIVEYLAQEVSELEN